MDGWKGKAKLAMFLQEGTNFVGLVGTGWMDEE